MRRSTNYTEEEKEHALKVFHQEKSSSRTRQILGYPSKELLRQWILAEGQSPKVYIVRRKTQNATYEEKISAIHRCFELGEDLSLVAEELNRHDATIRSWYRAYIKEGPSALMNKPGKKNLTKIASGTNEEDITKLKEQLLEMQLENDILRETINILKKDPGIDQTELTNKEKTVIVDAIRNNYSLSYILNKLMLSRSSYYYNHNVLKKENKYNYLVEPIKIIFKENQGRYGYRRIHAVLKTQGYVISEKIILKIMKQEELIVKFKKKKKYNSYRGEITPAVGNLLERDFHAELPNQKWLTDITEFAFPAGKVYLSPIVDCFDGALVSWTIGTNPNADLVNSMLDRAIDTLPSGVQPIVHSDRGCHYRWKEWIRKMNAAGLTRSMSKKGFSPDNSACEGFFGRLKNEMFYCVDWTGVTVKDFIKELNKYLEWYNNKRIKKSLGYLSPMEYRRSLGYAI